MAIHCLKPNDIGDDAEKLFNVTNVEGKNFLTDFQDIINNLKSHWKGSDAVANIKDLITVYDAIGKLMVDLQNQISDVNNFQILPMQKELISSGGTCLVGNELTPNSNLVETIAIPVDDGEVKTDDAIKDDAITFDSFPGKFQTFVDTLIFYKNELTSNWLDGADREIFIQLFTEFESSVLTHKSNLEKVKNNINTVAANKSKFL